MSRVSACLGVPRLKFSSPASRSTTVSSCVSATTAPSSSRTVACERHIQPAPAWPTRPRTKRVALSGAGTPNWETTSCVETLSFVRVLPPSSGTCSNKSRGSTGSFISSAAGRPKVSARLGLLSPSMARTRPCFRPSVRAMIPEIVVFPEPPFPPIAIIKAAAFLISIAGKKRFGNSLDALTRLRMLRGIGEREPSGHDGSSKQHDWIFADETKLHPVNGDRRRRRIRKLQAEVVKGMPTYHHQRRNRTCKPEKANRHYCSRDSVNREAVSVPVLSRR